MKEIECQVQEAKCEHQESSRKMETGKQVIIKQPMQEHFMLRKNSLTEAQGL